MNPILKRVLTGLVLGGSIVAAVLYAPFIVIAPVCGVLAVLAICELGALLKTKRLAEPGKAHAAFLFFTVFLVALFVTIALVAYRHGNVTLLFLLAIVKFSDVGGFAFGHLSARLLPGGNHKMCPAISPGKSWEGLFGSFVFSSLAAAAFVPLASALAPFGRVPAVLLAHGWGAACAFGLAAALIGTAGDLVESKLKRWVGVKDSSAMKITNGLGGFLDMFDSLLFAPLALYPFL